MARLGRSKPIKPHSGDPFRLFRTAAYTLACTAAAFTVTGNAANLHPSNSTLTASPAAYTLTGNAATLLYQQKTLTVQTAAFTFTGNNAALGYNAVIVDPATSYQTMRGWQSVAQGGHDNNATAGAYEYPSATWANYKDALLPAMAELGLNSLRVEIGLSDVNATGYDVDLNNAAIQPSTATSGQWHYERLIHAMDEIGNPYRTMLRARGESLYIVLCIVDFRSSGYAAEDTPSEYAFFVNKFVDKFYTTYGYLPDAIEPILEPDYGSNANWNYSKVADNIVAADALLVSNGYTGITWIAPSLFDAKGVEAYWSNMKAHNSSVTSLVSALSYHRYYFTAPTIDNTDLASLRSAADSDSKDMGMTEYITADHLNLYNDLITGHNAIWQQYTITFPYPSEADDGSQYFHINQTGWTVEINPRTKYLRHYFRYIRNGAVMKGVTNKSTSALGVPFVNTNGAYVVPIKCTGAINFDVIGLPAGTYLVRYTTGDGSSAPSAYDTALTTQTIAAGGTVHVAMPAAGIVTVFDAGYRLPMPTGTAAFALTGNATALRAQRVIAPAVQTFTLTGNAATLTHGTTNAYTLTAATATFALTGNAATLTVQRTIAPTAATFTLTGNAANLIAARTITADVAEFNFNLIAIASGSFGSGVYTPRGTYNGRPYFNLVGLDDDPFHYSLYYDGGEWVFTDISATYPAGNDTTWPWDADFSFYAADVSEGPSVGLTAARLISPSVGTFSFSGNTAGVTAQRLLTATTRTYSLTGIDAALTYSPVGSFTLSAQKGTFTLTGNAAGLTAQRTLALTKGTFTETGNAAGLNYGRTVSAATASFGLTGNAAGLRAGRYIAPAVASFILTGKLVTLNYSAAPSSKVDVVASDAAVNFITISDTALNAVSASDAAVTNLTIGDSTR